MKKTLLSKFKNKKNNIFLFLVSPILAACNNTQKLIGPLGEQVFTRLEDLMEVSPPVSSNYIIDSQTPNSSKGDGTSSLPITVAGSVDASPTISGYPLLEFTFNSDGKIDFTNISDVKNISISNSTAAASFTNLSNDLEKIFVTGNTVIDALQWVLKNIPEPVWDLPFHPSDKRMILVTGHRRENFGEGFQNICKAIKTLAVKNPNLEFVYPVHLNPNVQKPVKTLLANQHNIHLIEPLDYQKFVHFMNRSYFILSDSGGVQEEAPSIGKPVLVMRDTTERPEAVEAGTVMLVGTDQNQIVKNSQKLIDDKTHYQSMSFSHNPYGDGKASERITKIFYEKSKED